MPLDPPIDDFDVPVTRKKNARFWSDAQDEPLFICLICSDAVKQADRWRRRAMQERPPVCRSCAGRYGMKGSGSVWNRHNHHALAQVKAMINCLEWEIKNGRHRYR